MADLRSILHVDMDAFFASVEQLDDPRLRGKPVLVGSDRPRGVVAAASYEARKFGCHSAQPMVVAKRNCPHAIIVPVRFGRYRELSDQVFAIFDAFTPAVQPISIDEAFLDLTGTERLHGPPLQAARSIKGRIRDELHLCASIGVSHNKFLAKLASDMEKPDGLTVINPEDVDRILPALPVSRIWGIGPKSAKKLESIGVRTIGDLRAKSDGWLTRQFGADAEHYRQLSMGLDGREVTPDSQAKSIGQEETFVIDVNDPDAIRSVILTQIEQVSRRLRKHGLLAGTVTLKIRFGEFKTITRSRTLDASTNVTMQLWHAARGLFDEWAAADFKPIRLIGASVKSLVAGAGQLPLFADPQTQRQQNLDRAVDQINARLGKPAIRRGGA